MQTISDMERQNGQTQEIIRVGDVIVTWDGEFEYYVGEWNPVTRDEAAAALASSTPAPSNAQRHRAAWLREACRHQQNAAYAAAMAMGNRELGNLDLACSWQRGADASAYNARCNLFAAMNIKDEG